MHTRLLSGLSWIVIGYKKILEELNGRNIHRLENILILDINVHAEFEALEIWFESTVDTH